MLCMQLSNPCLTNHTVGILNAGLLSISFILKMNLEKKNKNLGLYCSRLRKFMSNSPLRTFLLPVYRIRIFFIINIAHELENFRNQEQYTNTIVLPIQTNQTLAIYEAQ